ncbi:unnamed protein product [Symbiodinium sp. CCMP2592]|nr:unnamed protein product [Symbiodinium sp. CCMP2592]
MMQVLAIGVFVVALSGRALQVGYTQGYHGQRQRIAKAMAEENSAAGDMSSSSLLVTYLLTEVVWGLMSPQQAQHISNLVMLDMRAGPAAVNEISTMAACGCNGKYPNKCYADIMKNCVPAEVKVPSPFLFPLPMKDPVGEIVQACLLPHELFASVWSSYKATWHHSILGSEGRLQEFWNTMEQGRHPAVTPELLNSKPGKTEETLFFIFALFDKLRVLGSDANASGPLMTSKATGFLAIYECGYSAMLFSFVGDLDYYFTVLGLPNSRAVNGPCTLCAAQKFGPRSWMDFSPGAEWRQSCFTAEGWFESSQRTSCPLFSLPHVSGLNLAYDWMHCKYLGVDQYMYAALMVLLTHYVMLGATPLENLRALWRDLKTEYERQQTPIRFRYLTSLRMFVRLRGSPKLRGKAAEIKYLAGPFAAVWDMHKTAGVVLHDQISIMLRLNARIEEILLAHRGDISFGSDAGVFKEALDGMLLLQYNISQELAASDPAIIMSITEKAHFLQHSSMLSHCLSPRLVWAFAGEDQQRRVQALGKASVRRLGPTGACFKIAGTVVVYIYFKKETAKGVEEVHSFPCKQGPSRPSDISKICIGSVTVLPEHLARYPVVETPVDQIGLFALEPGHSRSILRFSVFDRLRHHQQRTAANDWSLQDLATEAVRTAGERIRSVRVLTSFLPDLAVPQLVLTPAAAAFGHLCVPIDMRPHGGRPCTLLMRPGLTAQEVIELACHECPAGPAFALACAPRDCLILDAQGQIWDVLPADLSQLQWLRIQPTGGPDAAQAESTTSTTTTSDVQEPPTLSELEQILLRADSASRSALPSELHGVELLPRGVLHEAAYHVPLARLRMLPDLRPALNAGSVSRSVTFTVFVATHAPLSVQGSVDWTMIDFMRVSAQFAETTLHRLQMLTVAMPGLPTPQVALTEGSEIGDSTVIPIDLRGLGYGVLPLLLPPDFDRTSVLEAIALAAPQLRAAIEDPLSSHRLQLCDAQGQVWGHLPTSLTSIQWLTLSHAPVPAGHLDPLSLADAAGEVAGDEAGLLQLPADNVVQVPHPTGDADVGLPPSLLGKLAAHSTGLPCSSHVRIVPDYLNKPAALQRELVQLSWGGREGEETTHFTVFDTLHQVRVLPRDPKDSLQMCVGKALQATPVAISRIRVLTAPVPGFPLPQLVLHQAAHAEPLDTLVWDLRPIQQPVRTEALSKGQDLVTAFQQVVQPLPQAPALLEGWRNGHVVLVDALGLLEDVLPLDFEETQHVRAEVALFQGLAQAAFASDTWQPPPGSVTSTSTTTAMLVNYPHYPSRPPRHSVAEIHSLEVKIVRGRHCEQAVIQLPCLQIDGAISWLLRRVETATGPLQPTARLMLAKAQPSSTTPAHETVFVVLEDTSSVWSVFDTRHLASAGSLVVVRSVQGLSCHAAMEPACYQQGWTLFVNGAPIHLCQRGIDDGDFVQITLQGGFPLSVPTSVILEACPLLEAYTWGLPTPIVRNARQRRASLGFYRHAEGRCMVLGPCHAPAAFRTRHQYIPDHTEMREAVNELHDFPGRLCSISYAEAQFRHERCTSVFASSARHSALATLLLPAYGWPGHYVILLAPQNAPGLGALPIGHNFRVIAERRWSPGRVLRLCLDEPPPPPPVAPPVAPQAAQPAAAQQPPQQPAIRPDPEVDDEDMAPRAETEATSSMSLLQTTVRRSQRCPSPDLHRGGSALAASAREPPCGTNRRQGLPTPFGRRNIPRREPTKVQDAPGHLSAKCDDRVARDGSALVLDTAIPAPAREASLLFAVPADVMEPTLDSFDLAHCQRRLPASELLHPAARQLVYGLPVWSRSTPEAIMLFLDGAFEGGHCTWAVAAVVQVQGTWFWAGYFCGFVADCLSPGSAFEGELYAQFVARGVVARHSVPSAIFYDNTSAASVAAATAATTARTRLGSATAALQFLSLYRNVPVACQHVKSHQGHAGNEAADSLAKALLRAQLEPCAPADENLDACILAGDFDWLWIHAASTASSCWPQIDPDGASKPICPAAQGPALLTPATWQFETPAAAPPTKPRKLLFRCMTYNTLSCTSALQRRCLAEFMRAKKVSVVGLQECRQNLQGPQVVDGMLRIASPAPEGRQGCQLWFDLRALPYRPQDFRVLFSNPRMLVVLLHQDGFKATFVAGHAPDSAQDAQTRASWWELLDARLDAIPAHSEVVLLVDANARHTPGESPDNPNATEFQQICSKHCLCRTASHDRSGGTYRTWRSPQGVWACLDYIAIPQAWQHTFDEMGVHDILDTHAGIDHQPVLAEFTVQLHSPRPIRRRLDVDRLKGPEGRDIVQHCFLTMPDCPWHLSPDEHLQVINRHIQACLQQHFTRSGPVGRKPGISNQTLELLATKRGLRRIHHRRSRQQCKDVLYTCFRAWRNQHLSGTSPTSTWGYAPQAWDRLCARHIADMQRVSKEIRASSSRDEAAFSRAMFQEARGKGPAHLASLLRSVLKVGRRYKAPRTASAIVDQGHEVTDPEQIKQLFGQHFGEIEGAKPGRLSDMIQEPCENLLCDKRDIQGLPTLPALSAAFASLQPRRATGITGIPAEFYAACPAFAAMHHLPLVLKVAARQQAPTLWRGLLAVPLPKPGKPGHLLTGYRSIALMEPSIKAVAKAARPELIRAFEGVTLSTVGGARSRVPTDLPAAAVQLHLERLRRDSLSGSVVFVDGVTAFYSTTREILFEQGLPAYRKRVSEMQVEPGVRHRFLQHLDCKGALSGAGVPSALCDVLRCLLHKTWFTTDTGSEAIQCTTQGTTPGAPLADLLFQYALHSVLTALTEHLADEQLSAQLTVAGHDPALSDPVSWLDDVAVLLQSQTARHAAGDAARATALIHQYLSLIGIGLNLTRGKTEAIVAWHGVGAHEAQTQVMQREAGSVTLHIPGHTGLVLRCVSQYEHLGSLRTAGGDIGPAVEHRHREARSVYRAVKTRLLPNPNLTMHERQAIVHALIMSRFLHGAGTWLFGTNEAWDGFVARYCGLLKGTIRPLHGCSSGRLSQAEVCALTTALLPEEVLAVARVRLLACVAHNAGLFAKRQFSQHATWMLQLRADLALVASRINDPVLASYSCSDMPPELWLDSWPFSQAHAKNLLARFRRGCIASREHLVEPAIAKAHAHERVTKADLTFIRDVRCSARELRYQCPDCPALFVTRAAAAAHRSKVHGHLSASAQAFGTACEVCRRQYWSTARLAEHFRKAPHCAAVYRESDMAGTVTEAIADRRVPCAQLVGPQPWWATMAHDPLATLIPSPGANDPLPSLLALSPTRQLHSFFQLFACSVEMHGHDGVMEAIKGVVQGTEHWRLAVSVADVLDRADEMFIFQEGSLAAAYRNGALLFGPAVALRSAVARDWPFL